MELFELPPVESALHTRSQLRAWWLMRIHGYRIQRSHRTYVQGWKVPWRRWVTDYYLMRSP